MGQQRVADSSIVRRVLGGWVAALLRPRIATFKTLAADPTWIGVLISLMLAGVIAGLVRLVSSGATDQGPAGAFIAGLVTDWVVFCIIAAYLLVTTRLLTNPDGQRAQVYALSLFWPLLIVPLNLLGANGLLGGVGALLWLPATIYGLFLTYLTVQAAPGLSSRSARFVLVIPVILLILVGLLICGLLTVLSGNLNTVENK